MVAQLCEDTKNHSVAYFESVNFMVCKLYLKKFYEKILMTSL